jgi:hypothetical protein
MERPRHTEKETSNLPKNKKVTVGEQNRQTSVIEISQNLGFQVTQTGIGILLLRLNLY